MSIRTFNNLMQSKGCVPVISGVLLLLMIVGGLQRCGGNPNQPQDQNGVVEKPVATVGEYVITDQMIESMYQIQYNRIMEIQPGFQMSARMQATYYSELLDEQIRAGLYLLEAKKLGINITAQDVIKDAQSKIDSDLLNFRQNLLQQKILTEKSTQADFEAQLKQRAGKTSDELKKDAIDKLNQELKTPAGLARNAANVAQTLLPNVLAGRIHVTDDQLKATYRTLKVKRILLAGSTAEQDLAKAQADLKAGQSFEAVVNRYSKDPAPRGKKLGDVETTLDSTQLANKNYAPLLTMKVGDVSAPITLPEGTAIYKIDSIKNDLPKDFDKNKEMYRTEAASTQAKKQIQDDITDLQKSAKISWSNDAFKVLYSLKDLSMDLGTSKTDRDQKLKALAAEAQKAAQGSQDTESKKVASFAWYSIEDVLANDLTGAEKKAVEPDRIAAIQAAAGFAPGADLQLELANIYADQKDGANLAMALQSAVSQTSDFGQAGEHNIQEVKTTARMNDSILPADAKQSLSAAIDTWMKSKQAEDEQKKATEEASKASAAQNAADQQRLQDQMKAAAQGQKPGSKK